MKDLIEALEQILQRGIVVEPIDDGVWRPTGNGPFLIRALRDDEKRPERPDPTVRGW